MSDLRARRRLSGVPWKFRTGPFPRESVGLSSIVECGSLPRNGPTAANGRGDPEDIFIAGLCLSSVGAFCIAWKQKPLGKTQKPPGGL